jgi:hypothetical protein
VIRFLCPQCDKGLRADDSKAGTLAKCPACGHKVTIPDAEAEPPPPEDEEPEQPAPRKKKRPRFRPKPTQAARGKVLVLIICCVVLGMHLVSLIKYLATPDPVEMAKKQTREIYKSLGKDLPKDFEQKWEQDFDKVMGGKEMQAMLQRSKLTGLFWMLGSFSLSLFLLTFLYLRHDWARLVLGVLYLLGGFLGLVGLVFGGFAVLRFLGAGVAILTVIEMLVRLGVNFGIGVALMKSESIAAYTSGR